MSDYKQFLCKYYPYTVYNNEINNIYLRICENNIISEIFKRFMDEENNSMFFINIYLSKFNKLLLYLPLRDKDSIDICIRGSVENLLRFYYCTLEEVGLNKVERIPYRDLKDDLVINSFFENTQNKQHLNTLLSKYGDYSKSVHVVDIIKESEIDYLENIILRGEVDYLKLERDILKLLDTHILLTSMLFNISYKDFNASERLRMNNHLKSKRLQSVIRMLS